MKIIKDKPDTNKKENEYPLIPLREMIIFPLMQKTFYVGRYDSIESVKLSLSDYDKTIFLATQTESEIENPEEDDIYSIGTIFEIKKISPGPDRNIMKIHINALYRAEIKKYYNDNGFKKVIVEKIEPHKLDDIVKSEMLYSLIIKDFKKFTKYY